MTYFLVAAVIGALVAYWLTGSFFRGAQNASGRWLWFFIIWVVIMVLAYLPSR